MDALQEDSDERLLHDFVEGDEGAFERLLPRYRQPLFGIALNILRNPEDAEDAVQQTFLKVYLRASQFRGEAPAKAWLRRLTITSCLDQLRRRKVRGLIRPLAEAFNAAAPGRDTDLEMCYGELRRELDRLLARMPARQRTVFSLRVFEEWTLPEIAAALGISTGTVKTHLHRALKTVRHGLGALGYQPGRSAPVPLLEPA